MEAYVAPTSLNPRSWIYTIEYFSISRGYPISVYDGIGEDQVIVASNTRGGTGFVVCVYIKPIVGVCRVALLEPTTSVFRRGTNRPTNHVRVVTREVRAWSSESTAGWLENGAWLSVLMDPILMSDMRIGKVGRHQ